MLSPADSSHHLPPSQNPRVAGADRLPKPPAGGLCLTLLLWILRALGAEVRAALPVQVFYKFDSGRWRSRSTVQLHEVFRCR